MALSPREAYRRECNAVAATDPRWSKVAALDDCIVCGSSTPWRFKAKPKCAGCHSWLKDPDADTLPLLAPPVVIRPLTDAARLLCVNCGEKAIPTYDWYWAGSGKKKKLALGAYCISCKKWIKWVNAATYGPHAPPKPPVYMEPDEEYLFEDFAEPAEQKGNFFEVVGEGSGKKQSKEPLPPPPKDKPITPLERAALCVRLYEKGEKLYLNAKGEICCTNWDNLPDVITYGLKSCATRLKKAMIEDIYFQLRACEVSPHVLHVHPQDKGRLARIEAWKKGERKGLSDRGPELTVTEVVEMERESLGLSPTARALEKYERFMEHTDAQPVAVDTGGLF